MLTNRLRRFLSNEAAFAVFHTFSHISQSCPEDVLLVISSKVFMKTKSLVPSLVITKSGDP